MNPDIDAYTDSIGQDQTAQLLSYLNPFPNNKF